MELELTQIELQYAELRRKDAQKERHVLGSISEQGQKLPVVVVKASEANRYILVDGYKRYRAMRLLRLDTIESLVWELSEADALVFERLMRESEPDSALEQGWLLCTLRDEYGLSLDEMARRFDRSKSWVSRRIGLAEGLPSEVQEAVRKGRMGPHAAMKYLVPLARANKNDCIALVKALTGSLTTRQMGLLYAAYLSANREGKARLIADPALSLKALEAAATEDESDTPPDRLLLSDMMALAGIARRLTRFYEQGLLSQLDEHGRAQVREAARQAQFDTSTLFNRHIQEFEHAGPSHTDSHPAP
jgi:ParB family transcriptional regulator, chromosome partitioning protein